MFCPKCGTKNIDEAKFCGACGTPLAANAGMPAAQFARVQPSAAPGGKSALPFLIAGAAASFIVVVLVAVFVVVPAFNKNPFKGCQEGDVVEFGSYEQDGDISNGKEPIEWRVLRVTNRYAVVVSQKALDAHAYYEDEYYEDDVKNYFDDLDTWLENDFASQAFTDDEMKVIDEAPRLLCENEATGMSDEDRICMPTQQAVNNGAWTWGDNGACGWWLMSGSSDLYGAEFVGADGVVDSDARNLPSTDLAIRPAMEVKL